MPRSVAVHFVAPASAEPETQLGDATDRDDRDNGTSADGCDEHGEPERDLRRCQGTERRRSLSSGA